MTIEATCARVIVKADEEHGGSKIRVPDQFKKVSDRGTVVSVGPGRRHIDGKIYPLEIQVGQRVLFSRMGAFPFDEGGDKLFVMEEEQILAKILP
jgi:chaperonin GroES